MTEVKEFPQRYIEHGGRSIRVQVLNWESGDPPKYLVCNALESRADFPQLLLAEQRGGAWCVADLREAMKDFERLMEVFKVAHKFCDHSIDETSSIKTLMLRDVVRSATPFKS